MSSYTILELYANYDNSNDIKLEESIGQGHIDHYTVGDLNDDLLSSSIPYQSAQPLLLPTNPVVNLANEKDASVTLNQTGSQDPSRAEMMLYQMVKYLHGRTCGACF